MIEHLSTPAHAAPANYSKGAFLNDGNRVWVRAIRTSDKEQLLRHFERLSFVSRYNRFFRIKNDFNSDELRVFTEPDFFSHVALVAGGKRMSWYQRYRRRWPIHGPGRS
jgi:hypothetical protein